MPTVAELYELYNSKMLAAAKAISQGCVSADDVVQQVWADLSAKYPDGNVQDDVDPVQLTRVAVRSAKTARRRGHRACQLDEEMPLADDQDAGSKKQDLLLAIDQIAQAHLTDRQYDLLRMHFIEGYTLREIAAKYHTSLQAVSKRLKTIVALLKNNLT